MSALGLHEDVGAVQLAVNNGWVVELGDSAVPVALDPDVRSCGCEEAACHRARVVHRVEVPHVGSANRIVGQKRGSERTRDLSLHSC